MDDLGIAHCDGMTTKQASDLIKIAKVGLTISLSSPMRRDAACEIQALRCVVAYHNKSTADEVMGDHRQQSEGSRFQFGLGLSRGF